MTVKKFLTVILLTLTCALSAQQNPQFHFENYGTQDGLPSPEIHCALEDSSGYMWFGTDSGAARFDGYTFETFGTKEGLGSPVVLEIYEDKKGRIWLSTMTGHVYIWDAGVIKPWKYNAKVRQYATDVSKASLKFLAENETAYFELSGFGFVVIDATGKTDTIAGSLAGGSVAFKIPHTLSYIYAGIYKHHWAKYYDECTEMKSSGQWSIEVIDGTNNDRLLLPMYKNSAVAEYALGAESGLLFFHHGGVNYIEQGNLSWSIKFPFAVTHAVLNDDNSLWICLNNAKGLRRYENKEKLRTNGAYEQYLAQESVSCIVEDRQGGYWITTLNNGVFYCKNPKISVYNTAAGLQIDDATSVAFKNDSVFYIGLENSAIAEINRQSNKVSLLPPIYRNYQPQSLYFDTLRNRLYSHMSSYVDGEWKHAFFFDESRRKELIYNMHRPIAAVTNSEIYFSGNSGLKIYYKNTGIINSIEPSKNKTRTYDVCSDYKNTKWVGTDKGLQILSDDYNLLPPPHPHPSFHIRVEAIEQLPDSTFVFGTKGLGITFWKEDSIVNLTTDDGLTSNMIENIYADEPGVVWIGTLAGLNKVTRDGQGNYNIRQFNVTTGLPSNEINEVKSYRDELWVCTTKGLVRLHEHEEEKTAKAPVLQKITLNDTLPVHDSLAVFSFDHNNFNFRWLTLNFRQNGRIPYRYRLNVKQKWTYTTNLTADYPALPPGNYRFEVQSQNEDKYWSESTPYAFIVRPPWFETWWFSVLLTTLGGTLIYMFYRSRVRRLVKENNVQKQIENLEKSALQAQMNPHFIFNCLNSIQNYILQNDKKKAVEYLSRFAKLVRLNLAASVRGKINIEEEALLLDNYLALEKERFNHAFTYRIDLPESVRSENFEIPPLLIQPYVENAVLHGLNGRLRDGEITVTFSSQDNLLCVRIKDNGTPIDTHKYNRHTSKKHQSFGMSLTKKRLILLNGKDTVIIKKPDFSSAHNKGTEIIIKLKITKA